MADPKSFPKIRTDLAYYGVVTRVISATQFESTVLAGLGDGSLNNYAAYVLAKANGTTTAPHREQPAVTAYVSATGIFTHVAYTATLAVGDQLLLLHPNISTLVAAYYAAIMASIGPAGINQGLIYYGLVTGVPGVGQFEIATLAGLGDGQFIDLAGLAPYEAFVLRNADAPGGAPQAEHRPITNYGSATGGFSVAGFTIPVAVGDKVLIIHPFLARIMNLYGLPPATGNLAANWNTGAATSGNPGADLVTFGAANTKYKVHSLLVDIVNLTLAATIRVRMFMLVNGIERQIYNQTFVQGTDPDGLWIINGTLGIHEAVRVEVYSNNVADDGAVVAYDYMLELM